MKEIKVGDIWFEERYAEMRNPKCNMPEKIELIFRELVSRIQALERELALLQKEKAGGGDPFPTKR